MMNKSILILPSVLLLAACVSQPARSPGAGDFSRAPDSRGVSGVNNTATAILTRIAQEDEDD